MSATLDYMMVDGRCVHVREYLGVQPDQRPTGTCPAKDCAAPVIFVIGTQVTPHVRHKTGEGCSYAGATIAETAEHINAKCHIYNLLQACNTLTLSAQCSARHSRRWQWDAPAWDRVEMEYTIGNVRPDIVLFAGDKRMAVEIVHSHTVSEAKRRKLADLGILWIEVDTKLALAWTGKGAIRIAKADITTMPECPECIATETRRKAAEVATIRAQQERYGSIWNTRENERINRESETQRAEQEAERKTPEWTAEWKRLREQAEAAKIAQLTAEENARAEAERIKRARNPMFASMQDYYAARYWSEEQDVINRQTAIKRFAAERRATKAHWDRVWDEAAAAQAARTSAQG